MRPGDVANEEVIMRNGEINESDKCARLYRPRKQWQKSAVGEGLYPGQTGRLEGPHSPIPGQHIPD
jgi:hypothetical protein